MNKTYKIILLIIVILLFFISAISIYKKEFEISFENVAEIPVENDVLSKQGLTWFSLRDESYNGFYSPEILEKYGVDVKDINWDFSNFTYIITCGHKMDSIRFSFSKMKNRKFIFIPKQFIGILSLKKEETPYLYIYKIQKKDIDCDYHEPQSNILYVK